MSPTKIDEEIEKHEERLAQALEINRARRILECGRSLLQTAKGPSTVIKNLRDQGKTKWDGVKWVSFPESCLKRMSIAKLVPFLV
jgi:hypothetical protein